MEQTVQPVFSSDCAQCPRLAGFLAHVRCEYPGYYARPVPPFGDPSPRLLIVGLAPGMHGANRTGRPFTGDYAGILLYETLYRFGFSTAPVSKAADDGLRLTGCRITNAVKCLPPQNKPEPGEIRRCNAYLRQEIAALEEGTAILALGNIAHQAVVQALRLKAGGFPFGHGAVHALPRGMALYDSYHCSRYNTQTKRLTAEMFEGVFAVIRDRLQRN